MNSGVGYAVSAYVIWGLFPIYYKWLQHVAALQLLAHRIVWSCLTLAVVLLCARELRVFHANARRPATLRTYCLAAVLIAINWLAFVWAVTANLVVEASLGYFITPLVNVLLGVLFLGERLRGWQWVAMALATTGVVYLTFSYGAPPWIALTLAFSFGIYGLIKKTAPLGATQGLMLETAILFLPAVAFLWYVEGIGTAAFLHQDLTSDLLIIASGIVGTIPLLLFALATKRAPFSLVGMLFYIAPTLQFLVGVLLYGEPFTLARLVGFGIVWAALIIFSVERIFSGSVSVAAAAK